MGNEQFCLIEDYFSYHFPQPQYLGAKYKFLPWIGKFIPENIKTVLDPFAGSQSVSFYFKQLGYKTITNDFLNFNNQIGISLIENKNVILSNSDISFLFSENKNPSYYNLMEGLFLNLFFTESECKMLDSFRSNVDFLTPIKKAIALTVMNRSMTRKVTMGHFAHTKALEYASNFERIKRNRSLIRPLKDIFLELIKEYNNAVFDNGKNNKSYNMDAIELLKSLKKENIDLVYFDTPYCDSHADYQGFYHLLETYTNYWKDKEFKNSTNRYYPKKYSGFDTKKDIISSFEHLFSEAEQIPYWLISYNDRSYPSENEMVNLITKYKNVSVERKKYENGVGGKGSVKGSNEILFVCSPYT